MTTGASTFAGADFPAEVLWDLDGTLVDSEEYWFDAVDHLVRVHGHTMSSEQHARLVGASAEASAVVAIEAGVNAALTDVVATIVHAVAARPKPAPDPYLLAAARLGVHRQIVLSSRTREPARRLESPPVCG